jgi:uncharacterized membrane protein
VLLLGDGFDVRAFIDGLVFVSQLYWHHSVDKRAQIRSTVLPVAGIAATTFAQGLSK